MGAFYLRQVSWKNRGYFASCVCVAREVALHDVVVHDSMDTNYS
jgi:hypothetical protein